MVRTHKACLPVMETCLSEGNRLHKLSLVHVCTAILVLSLRHAVVVKRNSLKTRTRVTVTEDFLYIMHSVVLS